MVEGGQPPHSYSIHEAIAREGSLSEASGSLSAYPDEEDAFSDADNSPLGLHCLPTLSRRVSPARLATKHCGREIMSSFPEHSQLKLGGSLCSFDFRVSESFSAETSVSL